MIAVSEQYVLAVPRDALASAGFAAGFIPAEPALDILRQIHTAGDFLPRQKAERDQAWLQPIPCGLIHSDCRILVLERQERSKNHRLNRRLVLWAGGHVDFEDVLRGRQDLLPRSLRRELSEELDLKTGSPQLLGVVYDGHSLHFGVVYDVPALAPKEGTVGASSEFRLSKRTSPSGYFLMLEDLDKRYDQLEPWSKLILTELLGRHHPSSSETSLAQLPLQLIQEGSNEPGTAAAPVG